LTKSDLIAALKAAGVATKDDVRQIVGEEIASRGFATTDDIHNQLTEFFAGMIVPAFENLRKEMNARFEQIDHRLGKLETGQAHLKDQIEGLKADLSDTPSRKEFNELKAQVDRYSPTL